MSRLRLAFSLVRQRGLVWTSLYSIRSALLRTTRAVERRLVGIESARFLTGERTVSSSRHTAQENRQIWNTYDWTERGEEWTEAVRQYRGLEPDAWKQALVDGMMRRWVRPGATVLEIGPGAGRWSEILAGIAGPLIVADISEKCLTLTRARLGARPDTRFHLIGDDGLSFLDDASIDAVWSYDVFVHINPHDTRRYLDALPRILVPRGVAVLHHSGRYPTERDAEWSFRSHMDAPFFAHLASEAGLEVVEQNTTLPHKPGDVITVLRRPS